MDSKVQSDHFPWIIPLPTFITNHGIFHAYKKEKVQRNSQCSAPFLETVANSDIITASQ